MDAPHPYQLGPDLETLFARAFKPGFWCDEEIATKALARHAGINIDIDKASMAQIPAWIDGMARAGLLHLRADPEKPGKRQIFLPDEEVRKSVRDARAEQSDPTRDRTVWETVVDEDGSARQMPFNAPETIAERRRIAEVMLDGQERPNMVVPCPVGHDSSMYVSTRDGKRRCRKCRDEANRRRDAVAQHAEPTFG